MAHAAAGWPMEVCGLVARCPNGTLAVRPARNLSDLPGTFLLDPAVLVASHRQGEVLIALYHSHCDAPAILSAADRAAACLDGAPAWPGVALWVVPVVAGVAGPPVCYTWNDALADFTVRT